VSDENVSVILHRLEEMDKRLCQIHAEVRKTNGRVTSLEMENAKWKGFAEGRRIHGMIAASVISGGILAATIWFVTTAI
jgi:hypothetical protein